MQTFCCRVRSMQSTSQQQHRGYLKFKTQFHLRFADGSQVCSLEGHHLQNLQLPASAMYCCLEVGQACKDWNRVKAAFIRARRRHIDPHQPLYRSCTTCMLSSISAPPFACRVPACIRRLDCPAAKAGAGRLTICAGQRGHARRSLRVRAAQLGVQQWCSHSPWSAALCCNCTTKGGRPWLLCMLLLSLACDVHCYIH